VGEHFEERLLLVKATQSKPEHSRFRVRPEAIRHALQFCTHIPRSNWGDGACCLRRGDEPLSQHGRAQPEETREAEQEGDVPTPLEQRSWSQFTPDSNSSAAHSELFTPCQLTCEYSSFHFPPSNWSLKFCIFLLKLTSLKPSGLRVKRVKLR